MANADYRNAIAAIESEGSGGYQAEGPTTGSGDRAYGKYQIMGANIPVWTERVLGRRMTPAEFLANPQAQDAVFDSVFGGYVDQYGPEGAARAWFTGSPTGTGSDQLGTSADEYARRFMSYVGEAQPSGAAAAASRMGQGGQQRRDERSMGGSPFLENIRQRLRDAGRDTPFLDSMIANRKRRAQVDRPLLNWMRDQRQNAGYETPFLDRMLRASTPQPMAPAAPKMAAAPPPTPSVPRPPSPQEQAYGNFMSGNQGTPPAPLSPQEQAYGDFMSERQRVAAQQPREPAIFPPTPTNVPYVPPGPSTPATGVPYQPAYGPQQSILSQLTPPAPVRAPATMQTTLSNMAAKDLFRLIP